MRTSSIPVRSCTSNSVSFFRVGAIRQHPDVSVFGRLPRHQVEAPGWGGFLRSSAQCPLCPHGLRALPAWTRPVVCETRLGSVTTAAMKSAPVTADGRTVDMSEQLAWLTC